MFRSVGARVPIGVLSVVVAIGLAMAFSASTPIAWADEGAPAKPALTVGTVASEGSSAAEMSADAPSSEQPAAEQEEAVEPEPRIEADIAEGFYVLTRADYAKTRVAPASSSEKSGANVQLEKRKRNDMTQVWYIARDKKGYYSFVSLGSKRALTASGKATSKSGNVKQGKPKAVSSQKWAVYENDDGSISLAAKSSGLVLTASGRKSGSDIQVRPENGKASQRFSLTPFNVIADGTYSIGMADDTSRAIGIVNSSTKSGARVALGTYEKAFSQKFAVERVGDNNVYTIQAVHSGKRLAARGNLVVQAKRSSSKSQRWRAAFDGKAIVMENVSTGKVMTLAGKGDAAQLKLAKSTGLGVQHLGFAKRRIVDSGLYTLRSRAGAKMLDLKGGSSSDGANLNVRKPNGLNNQKFRVKYVANGYYKILGSKSGKAVQVAKGSKKTGANVNQGAYTGTANQLWKPIASPQGGITWVGKSSGKVLAIKGGKAANGANVCIAKNSSSKARAWVLKKTSKTADDKVGLRALKKVRARYSATNYSIAVDLTAHRTIVFKWSGGAWKIVKDYVVSTGAPSTPTVTGDFTVGIKGYSFGNGFTCYYYTQFYGDYLFHSILYNQGTFDVQDGRLGYSISHGCVRMNINDAYWIYSTIPAGTKVTVYY